MKTYADILALKIDFYNLKNERGRYVINFLTCRTITFEEITSAARCLAHRLQIPQRHAQLAHSYLVEGFGIPGVCGQVRNISAR